MDEAGLFCDCVCIGDTATNMVKWFLMNHLEPHVKDLPRYYKDWDRFVKELGVKAIYPEYGKPFPIEKLRLDIGRIMNTRKFPRVTSLWISRIANILGMTVRKRPCFDPRLKG